MANVIPFDLNSSLSLLTPKSSSVFRSEEEHHPWRARLYHTFDQPFLRLWDHYSGSQPSNDRLTSRAPYERLDTRDLRKASLTIHINHKIWQPTPYISFTTSPVEIQKIADMRVSRRGPHKLTVVDPCARAKKGLPILNVAAEMEHYEIQDPYGKEGRFYKDHYVCLWEVSSDEVVGEWRWDDLRCHANWYEDIIMPAFRQHQQKPVLNSSPEKSLDLSALARALPNVCDPPDPGCDLSGYSDASSEGFENHFKDEDGPVEVEGYWDSDDEVEENNASDDLIKMIEGLW